MANTAYTILLIEDNKLDQLAFTRMVEDEKLDYQCTVAGSVAEAQEVLKARAKEFDIVLSDFNLGDGTAFDIIDYVRSDTPIVLITGVGAAEIAVKAWRAGAYDYLIKDADRDYLKTVPITVENAISHKYMENRLRLLSQAIVSTEDCVFISDLDGMITFVNRAFCETYGYEQKEILGQHVNRLWQTSVAEEENVNSFQAVSGWEVGFFHKRKDGSAFPVSLTTSEVKDEKGNEIAQVSISRDISEHMAIESRLRINAETLQTRTHLYREMISQLTKKMKHTEKYVQAMRSMLDETHDESNSGRSQTMDKAVREMEKLMQEREIVLEILEMDDQTASEQIQQEPLPVAISYE